MCCDALTFGREQNGGVAVQVGDVLFRPAEGDLGISAEVVFQPVQFLDLNHTASSGSQVAVEGNVSLAHGQEIGTDICTINSPRHGGRDDAGEARACPQLQHGAPLEEVPPEQDVVRQEQGAPPHLF